MKWRYVIAFIVFLTTFTNYMIRFNMSVSILAMVERKKIRMDHVPYCLILEGKNNTEPNKESSSESAFHWNEVHQGSILSAYFWGFILTSIPAGLISSYLGAVNVLIYSNILTAVLNSLIPFIAHMGYRIVVAMRIATGLLGGFGYPCAMTLISQWAPPKERGKFLAAMMGNALGVVFSWNVLATVSTHWGWKWGFHVVSICLLFYCLVLVLVATDSPKTHRHISDEEREYIITSQEGHVSNTKKRVPPYGKILLSLPVWAVIIAEFGNYWGLIALMSYAPKFMAEHLGFDMKKSAFLAALPYLFRLASGLIIGPLGDFIRKKNLMSLSKTRRIFGFISFVLPAICLALILLCKCNPYYVVILMVAIQFFNGAVVMSHNNNVQDLAPNFSATIYGLMSTMGGATGMIIPLIHGVILEAFTEKLVGPHIIFLLASASFAFSGIFFIVFCSTDTQPWNDIIDDI